MKKFEFLIIPILFFLAGSLLQLYLDPKILPKLLILGTIAILSYMILIFLPRKILENPIIFMLLYILTILILIFNLTFGLKIAGTKRWIYLGSFTFQPSEFMKFILIPLLTFILKNSNITSRNKIMFTFIILLVPVILTFIQPDAGTAFILLSIGLSIILNEYSYKIPQIPNYFLIYGTSFILLFFTLILHWIFIFLLLFIIINNKYFFNKLGILILILLFITPLSLNYLAKSSLFRGYQQNRIKTFIILIKNKKLDEKLVEQENFNFNLKQSRITIGSGGLTGKGLQNITQTRLKFLPEYKTDFMYATIAEAFGFLGIITIITLYITLIWQVLNAKSNIPNNSSIELIKIGIASMLIIELIISMGSNLGLLPTKGIPLPFIAYGGTSLITHFMLLGLLANLSDNNKPI